MSRPEALLIANHLHCQGASFVKDIGWVPCKSVENFFTQVDFAVAPERTPTQTAALNAFRQLLLDREAF